MALKIGFTLTVLLIVSHVQAERYLTPLYKPTGILAPPPSPYNPPRHMTIHYKPAASSSSSIRIRRTVPEESEAHPTNENNLKLTIDESTGIPRLYISEGFVSTGNPKDQLATGSDRSTNVQIPVDRSILNQIIYRKSSNIDNGFNAVTTGEGSDFSEVEEFAPKI